MQALADVDNERLAALCEKYGIAELLLFGSAARNELTPDSDIDMLYALRPGRHLGWAIEDLADELAKLLGRPVDLVSRAALHARLRDTVLAEPQALYAA